MDNMNYGPPPIPPQMPPPVYQPAYQPPRFAGFWIRVLAYIIDSLVIAIPVGGLLWAVGVGDTAGNGVGLIVGWLYAAVMESSEWQATVGKRVLGLWVTDEEGRRISFGRATIRHFSKIVSAIILCIGFLMVAFTDRKQGLHDKMASTLVWRNPV